MLRIDVDDGEIARELTALASLVKAEGATLSPNVTIEGRGGDLRVTSDLPADPNATILAMPDSCLPGLAAAELYVAGDDIRVRRHGDGVGATQARALEHMLAVYNLTGKLAAHREASPWFALDGAPEVVDKLAAGRAGAPKVDAFHIDWRDGARDQLLLTTFLNTREFGAKGGVGRAEATSVLMPFIDYVNHHFHAPGFHGGGEGADYTVSIRNAKPVPGSDECFVSYSRLDTLDAYLIYNFPDDSGPHLRSVPLTIDCGDGKRIDVDARISGSHPGKLPEKMRDLRALMPRVAMPETGLIQVGHLFVPGPNAPRALRRILSGLIRTLFPDIGDAAFQDKVRAAEQAVLDANRRYYRELADVLSAARARATALPALATVRRVLELQTAKLDAYAERIDA